MSFLKEFNELYLNLTYRCNLDCPFCSTKFGGFFNKARDMSPETVRAGMDILLSNSVTPQPHLFFFGGEPLLRKDLIAEGVEYGRKHEKENGKSIRFVIVTNGVLLDDGFMEFLRKNRVELQINLDGPKEIHDSQRHFPGGAGTFDRVMENVEKAEKHREFHLTLRSHVPPSHPHFHETMDLLKSRKLFNLKIAFTMVMGMESGSEFLWKKEDYERHEQVFLDLVRKYRANISYKRAPGVDFFGLYGYHSAVKTRMEHFCNAGRVRLSIGPAGNVYPCFTMEDQPGFQVGHIDKGIDIFKMTNFLTVTSESGIRCADGSPIGDLFMYFCPYQNYTLSGKLNLVTPILKDSYEGFSRLMEKMKAEMDAPDEKKSKTPRRKKR